MSNTPETDAVLTEVKQHQIAFFTQECNFEGGLVTWENPIVTLCKRLERERDEARDTVEQLTKHGLDLMDANRMLKRKLKKPKENTK